MNKPNLLLKAILLLFAGWLPLILLGQKPSKQIYQPPPLTIEFLPEGGFYQDSLTIEMLSPGAIIYYTTDGTKPTESGAKRYSLPFKIKGTTVVRAMAILAGKRSLVFSRTFFISEPETQYPVISLSIAPSLLFDPVQGLFMRGTNAVDSLWQLPGANFWSRKELAANVEIFEGNGKLVWQNPVGLRLFGGMSRLFPQKSLAIVARSRYGSDRIRYPIFGKKGLKKFKYLVLRNSGSDFGRTHFRDALMTDLVKKWDLDVQDYRPAHVYINGKYWGIYNLREKVNRYFIAGHYNVDKDSIDLIEHKLTRRYGSTDHYRRLLNYLERNRLSVAANFAYVNSQMDVNNFLDYQIAQIYFDNKDAGGNIKFWRPQSPNGRWRWILYDTDWGFGFTDPKAYRNNSLAFHTEPNGPYWPNPPWSTFILRKLLENKEFERRFINRFADYLNDDLDSATVLAKIDKFYKHLLPEMPRHLNRWDIKQWEWENEVKVLRNFAANRPTFMRRFLMEKFKTGDIRDLSLSIAKGGKVIINQAIDFRDTFAGKYFEKIPIRLHAVPDLGYRFVRWEGEGVKSESQELVLELVRPKWHISAIFEKYEHPLAGKIIVNEISCNNKYSGDWVELYNNSKERVNLENWVLADRKNEFRFPLYNLPPKGYVVVCEDSAKFLKTHPKVQSVISGLSFGLNKRQETIQLFSPETSSVDSVGYNLPPMDSIFTYNLLLPSLDNSRASNWELTPGPGSPDAANAYYLTSQIQERRSLYMQVGGAMGVLILGLLLLWLRKKGLF